MNVPRPRPHPRRVPWSTLTEIDQLCLWVYSEDAHDSSRDRAIERLSAWKFMTPLPHALESLLSILVAIRQEDTTSTASPSSSLSLRQSYATAIIRLVNGLVDPLQVGAYARPILSIAAQIGLPAWLVELRHAATHEDLPSLELLRDGAKESLSWLLQNYFLPMLNPALTPTLPRSSIRPLEPLLRQYKSLLKSVSRDASLRTRHEADVSRVLREIERWLSEARITADARTSEFGWQSYAPTAGDFTAADGDDPREAWALDRLCEALLLRGALVPISRKKRDPPKGSHRPPSSLLVIWTPLLEKIAANHAHFFATLTSHIVAHLLANPLEECDDAAMAAERASYDVCLATWCAWLAGCHHGDEIDAEVAARREDVFLQLVHALDPHHETPQRSQQGARALLRALCDSDRRLAGISATILSMAHVSSVNVANWNERNLEVMEIRLKEVLSVSGPVGDSQPSADFEVEGQGALPTGWRLLSADGWRPCPIGKGI
ncbi:Las1-like-domain-containing protein [Multifurca ochricompacta]|uniref:Las1-like-domain-containing protein n=1 Tax=Multifurca ochricompacta TaxID=376703 RepID=A0AAD4MCI5_9AGAM|nr:Las1-like-domain-containing protein [Multifurca ochricompacta]